MIKRFELSQYLDQLLSANSFKDYCPNGLQVQGKSEIKTLVTGVTANQALIDAAIAADADAILVHHGFFWKNEPMSVVGMKYHRMKSLLAKEINLFAYHLPLDAHMTFGNNIQLGQLLGVEFQQAFEVDGVSLGFVGALKSSTSADQFSRVINSKLGREPLHIAGSDRDISRIAWCTGAAQDFLLPALDYHIDAYLTGEVSERTVHIARENNVHFFAAGHHATERYGVKALGEHLSQEFGLQHIFIDIDNPV